MLSGAGETVFFDAVSDLLRTRASSSKAMLAVFDDSETISHALAFEAALAAAEAAEGLIPQGIAADIARVCAMPASQPGRVGR